MSERCRAAHVEDLSPCEGLPTAVMIEDKFGDMVTGCVRHGAAFLASLEGGKVRQGEGGGGEAIETFQRAQKLGPFSWRRNRK